LAASAFTSAALAATALAAALVDVHAVPSAFTLAALAASAAFLMFLPMCSNTHRNRCTQASVSLLLLLQTRVCVSGFGGGTVGIFGKAVFRGISLLFFEKGKDFFFQVASGHDGTFPLGFFPFFSIFCAFCPGVFFFFG
jgi:hypothetical protein